MTTDAVPRSSVIRALAGADGRRLLRHPAFLAGMAMAVLGSVLFLVPVWTRGTATWDEEGWTTYVGAVFLAILTMIATNLAALRDRREHTSEQHGTLPVEPVTRTAGLLRATAWPAVAAGALMIVVVALAAWRGEIVTAAQAAQLVERVVAIVLLGVIGVALAVWLPRSFVAVLLAWAFVFVNPGEETASWRTLVLFGGTGTLRFATWRLVYLVGLAGVVAVVALSRWERRAGLLIAGGVALAVVVAAAAVLVGSTCTSNGICVP
jgi:hypothetical protein